MKIGIPREIKPNEYRVGLTPSSAREYVLHGHSVLVEAGAAQASAPASRLRASRGVDHFVGEEVFALADMIVKVKERSRSNGDG